MKANFWEIKCRRGAWYGKVYLLAPSEWEAGKQTEIALSQLGLDAEVVEVNVFPGVSTRPIEPTSAVQNSCILCGRSLGEEPIDRRTVIGPVTRVPLLGNVRILGESCFQTCPECGKSEQWRTNFGYIPEVWFNGQAQIIPLVGRFLKRSREVNVT